MSSILVEEDGTGVADANSYAAAEETRTYADLRGITLAAAPEAGNDPVEQWLILAAEYLDSLAFVGYRATGTQGLEWPRILTEPYLNYPFHRGLIFPSLFDIDPSFYVLPTKLKFAQMQLVIEQNNGIELMPSSPGGLAGQFITREKVDVIETNYSEKLGTLATPTMFIVNSLLRGLLVPGGGTAAIRAVRV